MKSKLRISKFAITYRHFYLWVNPFGKETYMWRGMWLNIRLIYCFVKANIRNLYRWLFHKKLRPLTDEEKLKVAKMFKELLDDIAPMINTIHAKEEYKKIKEQWEEYRKDENK